MLSVLWSRADEADLPGCAAVSLASSESGLTPATGFHRIRHFGFIANPINHRAAGRLLCGKLQSSASAASKPPYPRPRHQGCNRTIRASASAPRCQTAQKTARSPGPPVQIPIDPALHPAVQTSSFLGHPPARPTHPSRLAGVQETLRQPTVVLGQGKHKTAVGSARVDPPENYSDQRAMPGKSVGRSAGGPVGARPRMEELKRGQIAEASSSGARADPGRRSGFDGWVYKVVW